MSINRCLAFYILLNSLTLVVRTKNQKSRLVFTVQAFCEEKGLRSLSGVFGYAESKNQCWQVEKWLFIDLICIFSRWPPKTTELILYREILGYFLS